MWIRLYLQKYLKPNRYSLELEYDHLDPRLVILDHLMISILSTHDQQTYYYWDREQDASCYSTNLKRVLLLIIRLASPLPR